MANKFRDLLLRIGIDTKGFNADIGKVQRQITAFSNQAQTLGKSLTTSLTLPLGLAGAAAVKTFADFDRLEKGLDVFATQGTTGAEELDKLLNVVKDARTTLDLKSAASGALQLQAVGIEADKARNIIKQLGIAATVSGSEIADISEIVRQFAQSLSLGRVLETDLRIIKQRIPAIGKILKDEFGTVTAEGLRSAGVSAQEFVDRLVKSIETNTDFQNVQISAAKAIETFTTNIQIAVAEIGKIISESIDLIGTLDYISNGVARLTVFLKSLDSSTRETVVKIALFAASIGPVLLGISAVIKSGLLLKTTIAFLGNGFLDLVKVFGLSAVNLRNVAGQFKVAGNAAKGFALAVRSIALPIAAVTGAVLIVKKIFNDYQVQLDRVNRTQDTLNDIQKETASTLEQRTVEVRGLINAIKNENTTVANKERLLKQLNSVTNDQFKDVKILKGEVVGLDKATNDYTETLKKQIETEVAINKIRELEARKARIAKGDLDEINLSLADYLRIGGSILTGGGIGGAFQAGGVAAKRATEEIESLDDAIKAVYDSLAELYETPISTDNEITESAEGTANAVKSIFQELQDELAKIDFFGALYEKSKLQIAEEKLSAIKKALSDAYDIENATERTRVLNLITLEFVKQKEVVDTLKLAINDYNKTIQELGQIEFSGKLEGKSLIDIIQEQLSAIKDAQVDIPVESIDFLLLEDKYDELVKKLQTEVQSFIFNDLEKDLESVSHDAENFGLSIEDLNDIKIDKLIDYLGLVYDVLGENSQSADIVKKKLAELGVVANASTQQIKTFKDWVKANTQEILSLVERGVSNIFQIISEGFARRNEAKANLEEARKELLKLEATGRATKEELQAAEAAVLGFSRTVASNDLFENIARAFRQIVAEIGKAILKALIFAAIVAALAALVPGLKEGLKVAGFVSDVGGGGGGKIDLFKLLGAQLFASGGLVYGPVNAIIGEGQGTNRRNPEVVAPLDKLKEYINGNGAMMLTSRLSGSDLLLSVERAKRNRDR